MNICKATASLGSAVGFQSTALASGNYVVVADSQAGNGGNYSLTVSRSTTLGDGCADARVLTLNGTRAIVAGDTTGFNQTFVCVTGSQFIQTSPDSVFEFVAPRAGMLTISALSVGWDIAIGVRTGATCSGSMYLSCNDTRPVPEEAVTMPVTAGTRYWIEIFGYDGAKGAYTLELQLP